MTKSPLRFIVSLAMAVLSSATVAKTVHSVNMSFCDVGTSCQKCSETVAVKFEQDGKSVFMSGKGIDGKHVRDSLSNCTFTSKGDWTCNEVRMSISSESGKISARLLKDLSVSGKKQEVCVTK